MPEDKTRTDSSSDSEFEVLVKSFAAMEGDNCVDKEDTDTAEGMGDGGGDELDSLQLTTKKESEEVLNTQIDDKIMEAAAIIEPFFKIKDALNATNAALRSVIDKTKDATNHQLKNRSKITLISTLLGFTLAFVFFTSYTIIFESFKSSQLSHYTNLTLYEREQVEKLRAGQDSLRNVLIHKSYEEARKSYDDFLKCQQTLDQARGEMSLLQKGKEDYAKKIGELESSLHTKGNLNSKLIEFKELAIRYKNENAELKKELGKWKWGFICVLLLLGLYLWGSGGAGNYGGSGCRP